VLCAATIALLIALRKVKTLREKFGAVLGSVRRHSHGEIYFALGVTAIFCRVKDDLLLYAIPILVLTFADAAAALIGEHYGRHRIRLVESQKSIEGCIAFLTFAAAFIYAPLMMLAKIEWVSAMVVAVTLALILTVVEACAWSGFDNFMIPVAGCFFLENLLRRTNEELLMVSMLTTLVIFTLLLGQERSYADHN
jgi:phytol kinase